MILDISGARVAVGDTKFIVTQYEVITNSHGYFFFRWSTRSCWLYTARSTRYVCDAISNYTFFYYFPHNSSHLFYGCGVGNCNTSYYHIYYLVRHTTEMYSCFCHCNNFLKLSEHLGAILWLDNHSSFIT